MKQDLDAIAEQILFQGDGIATQGNDDGELLAKLVAKLTEQGAEGGDETKIKAKAQALLDKWNAQAGEMDASESTGEEEFQNLAPSSVL